MSTSPDSLMRATDVAARLGIHRQRVYEMHRDGTLPAIIISERTMRWRPEAVEAFIQAAETQGDR